MTPVFQTEYQLLQLIDSNTIQDGIKLERRDFVESLIEFCTNNEFDAKLGVIYGLRLTGKTVGMLQAAEFLLQQENKVAYTMINYQESDIRDVNSEMLTLAKSGYTHFFIDEAPYLEGFLNNSAEWANLFVPLHHLKIIITGTDNLLLWFSMHRALLDQFVCFSTNRNTFPEYRRLTGKGYNDYKIKGGVFFSHAYNSEFIPVTIDPYMENFIYDAVVENLIHTLEHCKDDDSTGNYYSYMLQDIDKVDIFKDIILVIEFAALTIARNNFIKDSKIIPRLENNKYDIKTQIVDQIEIYQNSKKIKHSEDSRKRYYAFISFLIEIGLLIESESASSDLAKPKSTLYFDHPTLLNYELHLTKYAMYKVKDIYKDAFAKNFYQVTDGALNEAIVYCHFILLSDEEDKIFLYQDNKQREIDVVSINRRLNRLRLIEVKINTIIVSNVFTDEAKDLYDDEILKNICISENFTITRIIAYSGSNRRVANEKGDLYLLDIEDLLCRIKDLDDFIGEISICP